MNNFFHLTFGHVRMIVNWSIQLTNGQKILFRFHTRSCENDLQLAYLAHELIEKNFYRSHAHSRENAPQNGSFSSQMGQKFSFLTLHSLT